MDVAGHREARTVALRLAGILLLPCLVAACGETSRRVVRPEEDLAAPFSGVRTRAVGEVLRTGDQERVPQLIELLDDPDPAVRMAAGSALRDLTGRDTGYTPWAEADELRRQVLDWRAWWSARSASAPRPEPLP